MIFCGKFIGFFPSFWMVIFTERNLYILSLEKLYFINIDFLRLCVSNVQTKGWLQTYIAKKTTCLTISSFHKSGPDLKILYLGM